MTNISRDVLSILANKVAVFQVMYVILSGLWMVQRLLGAQGPSRLLSSTEMSHVLVL